MIFAEKLRLPLLGNSVPVVISYPDIHHVAPPNSYINVQDFKSPRHLAEYLKYLDQNDKEYLQYYEWKKRYRIYGVGSLTTGTFCQVCNFLHSTVKEPQIVADIHEWFYSDSDCKPDILKQLGKTH